MRANRQKRMASSDRLADFESVYEKYSSLSVRRGTTPVPKAELLPLLSNEGLCDALVQEEAGREDAAGGDGAAAAKLLRQMRKMLVDAATTLVENQTVLRQDEAQAPMYVEGDEAIATIDGVPRRVKLAEPLKNLDMRTVEVRPVDGGDGRRSKREKCEVASLILLCTEQKPKAATLLRVDRQRAVAVTCDTDSSSGTTAGGADEVQVWTILSFAAPPPLHSCCLSSEGCSKLTVSSMPIRVPARRHPAAHPQDKAARPLRRGALNALQDRRHGERLSLWSYCQRRNLSLLLTAVRRGSSNAAHAPAGAALLPHPDQD
eukprot:SAG22_NODE_563_length_9067_cov_5.039251_3_plen_318_part_00